jgi:hypothetical protein
LVSFLHSYFEKIQGKNKVIVGMLGCGFHCLLPSSSSEGLKGLLDVLQWVKDILEKTSLNLRREIGSGNAVLQKMLLERLA